MFSLENKQQYTEAIRDLRMRELRCEERMPTLRAGMASILPIQLLPLATAADMELRTCGLPLVNLDFLKVSYYLSCVTEFFNSLKRLSNLGD